MDNKNFSESRGPHLTIFPTYPHFTLTLCLPTPTPLPSPRPGPRESCGLQGRRVRWDQGGPARRHGAVTLTQTLETSGYGTMVLCTLPGWGYHETARVLRTMANTRGHALEESTPSIRSRKK